MLVLFELLTLYYIGLGSNQINGPPASKNNCNWEQPKITLGNLQISKTFDL